MWFLAVQFFQKLRGAWNGSFDQPVDFDIRKICIGLLYSSSRTSSSVRHILTPEEKQGSRSSTRRVGLNFGLPTRSASLPCSLPAISSANPPARLSLQCPPIGHGRYQYPECDHAAFLLASDDCACPPCLMSSSEVQISSSPFSLLG